MNIIESLENKLKLLNKKELLIIIADNSDWYEILGYLEEHPEYKDNILVLNRFKNDFIIIPEKSMNLIGWYHE